MGLIVNFSWGICAICVLYIIDTLCDFICPKLQNVGHNENSMQDARYVGMQFALYIYMIFRFIHFFVCFVSIYLNRVLRSEASLGI